ncbi:DUF3786 domain-containing protein [Desulfoluna sp.]|uniref:DUF3786 domain-containing protein n=1 Tax=Desulfoluna sp. TaxID=2045199 RepID=UPI0026017663|nr:DUF3786 domain-containing protein [Desulfoluna sp.]
MVEKAPIFEKIRKDYLLQVAGLEAPDRIREVLDLTGQDTVYQIPFFNRRYTITSDGCVDETGAEASHAACVVLSKYLLLCPPRVSEDVSLVTYKDFKDAAPYVGGFRSTVESPIARDFDGALDRLEQRSLHLGGRPFDTDVSCQFAYQFQALPKVPVFLLFNDTDDEFPAQATLLFQRNAAAYLDMECLAMVGAILAVWLKNNP